MGKVVGLPDAAQSSRRSRQSRLNSVSKGSAETPPTKRVLGMTTDDGQVSSQKGRRNYAEDREQELTPRRDFGGEVVA